jgi:nucleoside-triphosphatase
VDIDSLDRVGVSALSQAARERSLVIIDEIGKMELFSANFREAVLSIINHGKKVLGTIMSSPHPWADLIKQKPGVKLIEVTRANHHQVLKELSSWLGTDLSSN